MDPKDSRGYRNNNPGNIDHHESNKWQGLANPPLEPPPRDGKRRRFARFVSPQYGIRALAMLLTTYQDRHNLRTIQGIVARWAPGVENDVAAYVRQVARLTGRRPTDRLDLHTWEDLRPLVVAIITHEIGGQPYSAAVVDEGLRLAGVERPVTTMAGAAASGTGRGALQAAGATGAAATVVTVAPALAGLQGLDWRVALAVVGLAFVAAVGWVLLQRRSAGRKVAGIEEADA